MRRIPFYRIPVDQIIPRSMRPDELRNVRGVWWRLRQREGVKLPPQDGVILVRGDRP